MWNCRTAGHGTLAAKWRHYTPPRRCHQEGWCPTRQIRGSSDKSVRDEVTSLQNCSLELPNWTRLEVEILAQLVVMQLGRFTVEHRTDGGSNLAIPTTTRGSAI